MKFRNLFSGRKSEAPAPKQSSDVRPELLDVVENAIVRIIAANFAVMGVNQVPVTGETGSLRSRGYLLGLTEAVLQQFSQLSPTNEEFVSAYAIAFAATYGPCDWNWALDTIDEFQADNPQVMDGVLLARRDVATVYSDQPMKIFTGFWLLTNGDEGAVEYNVAYLREASKA